MTLESDGRLRESMAVEPPPSQRLGIAASSLKGCWTMPSASPDGWGV
ncbi:MAG: hypothetical protein V1757_07460 [Actinomycetota bacterium]